VHSLASKNKLWEFWDGIKTNSQAKMLKWIYTNEKKEWLVQIEAKIWGVDKPWDTNL